MRRATSAAQGLRRHFLWRPSLAWLGEGAEAIARPPDVARTGNEGTRRGTVHRLVSARKHSSPTAVERVEAEAYSCRRTEACVRKMTAAVRRVLLPLSAVCLLSVVDGFRLLPMPLPRGVSQVQNSGGCGRFDGSRCAAARRSSGARTARMAQASDYVPVPKPLLDKVNFPMDLKGLSIAELKQLSYELRWETIEQVSRTGGHLSSSLGVTELTVALHYVFNTPDDKIIWDVAHQCYPHKMLTGRRSRFPTLRQWNGLSGFTKRKESEYDCFGAGHSSTSISAALGMSVGKQLTGKTVNNCIAVIGDGAITGGMAYEAMNCAGYLKQRMIVVLNDNGQVSLPTGTPSAAGVAPVGALSASSTKVLTSREFLDAREAAKGLSKLLPNDLQKIVRKADEVARSALSENEHAQLWEELGFYYLGPIDGHDLDNLVPILENLRDSDSQKPVLLHIKTEKGKGYAPALKAPDRMHGVAQFDISTGQQKKGAGGGPPSYTNVFSTTLCELARQDPTVVGITAAMPGGTGLDYFGKFFPKRTFDVGIAEQHAVTFAAGMAVEGLKPFCAIYSTFLQRGYDQVVHDCVIQSLPVRFMIDRAGLVGNDGPTHHGCYDLAYLGTLPNIVVMAPADEIELMRMIKTAWVIDDKPSCVRYPRGNGYGAEGLNKLFGYSFEEAPGPGDVSAIKVGEGRVVRRADPEKKLKVALLTIGTRLEQAVKAAGMLTEETADVGVTVADARFMKPLDKEMILQLADTHDVLVTAEEGSVGGFGEHVLSLLTNEGALDDGKCRVRTMVIPDEFIEAGGQKQQYDIAGLTAKHIAATALKALDRPGLALDVMAKGETVLAGEAPTVA